MVPDLIFTAPLAIHRIPKTAPAHSRFIRGRVGLRLGVVALGLMLAPAVAPAFGVLIPRERVPSAIEVGEGRVDVAIDQRLATTRIRQSFYNPNPRQLEADFYFPVPQGAQIVDFALTVNGVMTKAETLPQAQARKIYEDIVRQAKDPGLIEWVDRDLYRVRIFPVPAQGTQEIEVAYAQGLDADQGLFRYSLPIQRPNVTGTAPGRPVPAPFNSGGGIRPVPGGRGDSMVMPVKVTVRTSDTLRMVQSPTHEAKVTRPNDREAVLEFAGDALANSPSRVLEVHFLPTSKPVALAAVAGRPLTDEDGYFSLTLSPPWKAPGPDAAGLPAPPPQDIIFIIDTSGSMADRTDKIGQARRALTTCLRQIRPEDRFALVRFASDVSTFRPELIPATDANRQAGLDWVERLVARGGTNISGALEEALAVLDRTPAATTGSQAKSATVLFLTDGIANVGLTKPEDIVRLAKRDSGRPARLFTFGVGYDVQAVMLDRLAQETGGTADYVRPDEDLEIPVSRLFNKVSLPAMTGLRLTVEGAETRDLVPSRLPDLFHGTEVTILGRYRGGDKPTTATLKIQGDLYGQPASFETLVSLPVSDKSAPYLETLWATRKLASLLDGYRKGGEASGDLKKEIEELCTRHNLVSPFTSMLVVEDQAPQVGLRSNRPVAMRDARRSRSFLGVPAESSAPGAPSPLASSARAAGDTAGFDPVQGTISNGDVWRVQPESGAAAVNQSIELDKMRKEVSVGSSSERLLKDRKRIGGISFTQQQNPDGSVLWVDTQLSDSERQSSDRIRIPHLSEAWFELAANPDWREILQLGDRIILKWKGKVVEITGPGTGEGAQSALNDSLRKALLP